MPRRKTMQTLTKITQSFVTGRQGHHIAVLCVVFRIRIRIRIRIGSVFNRAIGSGSGSVI